MHDLIGGPRRRDLDVSADVVRESLRRPRITRETEAEPSPRDVFTDEIGRGKHHREMTFKLVRSAAREDPDDRRPLGYRLRWSGLGKRRLFEQVRTDESYMHELSFSFEETKALIEAHYHRAEDED